MFTNQDEVNDTWVMTDPEASFWMNGTELQVDDEGRVNLNLTLQPTIWGNSDNNPLDGDMWDTSTWRWHGLNEFYFTARDPAGNWNHANASMVYDPWAPANTGPTPQLSFDSIRVAEWGDVFVPVQLFPYSFNVGEFSISRLFDGRHICLSVYSSKGIEMEQQCHVDNAPPWEEVPGSNRPIMEENRFTINFTDWADDLYELQLSVTDWANNTGTHSTEILIDRTAPEIQITTPTQLQIQPDHHLEIEWNVSELSYQWVEINGEHVWSTGGYQNGSQQLLTELNRTGNHSVCIYAMDSSAIDGIVDSNIAQSCIDTILPEETYWPTLEATWNNTHVNTSRVWAHLTLGPDQIYSWWHDGQNGSLFVIEDGRVSVPLDLNVGDNNLVFHLNALEKTFVYELTVVLDQTYPELIVYSPVDTHSTYRSIANVIGTCEYALPVIVDVNNIITEGNFTENGTDVLAWSIDIQNDDRDVFSQSGQGSDFDGIQPKSFSTDGEPGVWTATLDLVDAAGNRQRLQISTILDAPEATNGEQLKTIGSIQNLVALSIIVILLSIFQMMFVRKTRNTNPLGVMWPSPSTEYSTEISAADSMFEDDVVVSDGEATLSNTE